MTSSSFARRGGVRAALIWWMDSERSRGGVPTTIGVSSPPPTGTPTTVWGGAGGAVSTTMWLRPVWNRVSRSYLRSKKHAVNSLQTITLHCQKHFRRKGLVSGKLLSSTLLQQQPHQGQEDLRFTTIGESVLLGRIFKCPSSHRVQSTDILRHLVLPLMCDGYHMCCRG